MIRRHFIGLLVIAFCIHTLFLIRNIRFNRINLLESSTVNSTQTTDNNLELKLDTQRPNDVATSEEVYSETSTTRNSLLKSQGSTNIDEIYRKMHSSYTTVELNNDSVVSTISQHSTLQGNEVKRSSTEQVYGTTIQSKMQLQSIATNYLNSTTVPPYSSTVSTNASTVANNNDDIHNNGAIIIFPTRKTEVSNASLVGKRIEEVTSIDKNHYEVTVSFPPAFRTDEHVDIGSSGDQPLPISTHKSTYYQLSHKYLCYPDVTLNLSASEICRPICNQTGYVGLTGMDACIPQLNCDDLRRLNPIRKLANSFVKNLTLERWSQGGGNNYSVIIVKASVTSRKWQGHFNEGLRNLESLSKYAPSLVANFLGSCNGSSIFMEYYPLGSPKGLSKLYRDPIVSPLLTPEVLFGLCVDIAEFLAMLRNHPKGPFVMYDTDSAYKTLSQFVIRSDLHLLASDIDMLPRNGTRMQCRSDTLLPFIPPEKSCSNGSVTRATVEQTVWEFAGTCSHILSVPGVGKQDWTELSGFYGHRFIRQVKRLFERCKKVNPVDRPHIDELLEEMKRIRNLLKHDDT